MIDRRVANALAFEPARTFHRRAWLVGSVGLLAAPLLAQQPKVQRIGYLASGWPASAVHDAFRQGLRELGWIEGGNIVIEYRFAEGRYEALPELAAELVRLKVDLIVAGPTPAAVAAKSATATIPIVIVSTSDPVGLGLIASLARPGGNVTGTAFSVGVETVGKGLQLLTEALPRVQRVAVLWNPTNPAQALAIGDLKVAAGPLRVQLVPLEVRGPDDFDAAFAAMTRERVEALLVVPESVFIAHRTRVAELALRNRLPSMHGFRDSVEAGGLMSYGPSAAETARRAASFVDRILKGARPADLSVEQPTKFELVINLKTAKALGVAIPRPVLLRADEVIE